MEPRGYRPCYKCGKKPKSYRTDYGEWNLDHDCRFQYGTLYVGGDTLSGVMKTWNQAQKSCADAYQESVKADDGK